MLKIPFPGGGFIETEQTQMTPTEMDEHDRFWEQYDHNFTLLYQNKLVALGYPSSYDEAKNIFKNFDLRHKIDNEYHELESTNALAEMVGRLEKLKRELEG